jgi:predicted ester cyclase
VTYVETLRGAVTALQTEILARRYYECFNQRDFDAGERHVDPQAVFTYPRSSQQFIGRAGYRELARRWVSAFPDSSYSIAHVRVLDESTVRTEWVMHGTHLGVLSLPGLALMPPTEVHAHVKFRETIRIANGMIVESVLDFDPDDLRSRLSA